MKYQVLYAVLFAVSTQLFAGPVQAQCSMMPSGYTSYPPAQDPICFKVHSGGDRREYDGPYDHEQLCKKLDSELNYWWVPKKVIETVAIRFNQGLAAYCAEQDRRYTQFIVIGKTKCTLAWGQRCEPTVQVGKTKDAILDFCSKRGHSARVTTVDHHTSADVALRGVRQDVCECIPYSEMFCQGVGLVHRWVWE